MIIRYSQKTSMTLKIILPLFLLLFSGACQKAGKGKREQILRLNIHSEPPTLDSRKATDSVSIFVIKQCQEGLMQRGEEGAPLPGIAESVEVSEDGLIYTFYLRKAVWSNDKPLTAYDFERSWKTLLDPAFPSENAFELYLLKNGRAAREEGAPMESVGVRALDAGTLRVELEHRAPYFLSLITIHPFFPIADPVDPFVSSGAFVLEAWRHGDQIILKKNKRYWAQEEVKLLGVRLYIIDNDQTELQLFEKGELDWAGHPFSNLPADALPEISQKETIHSLPLAATYQYAFNTQVFPLHNLNFRRALSLAINRKAIVENITQSGQIPTTSLIPPLLWGEKGRAPLKESLEEAKECFQRALTELQLTVDQLPPVTISYNTMSGHHKIAQAIQQQWARAFGLKVRLENKEWKVFLDDCLRGNFQIAKSAISATIDDPISFLDLYHYPNSSRNHSRWNNPKFRRLIDAAEHTKDPKERLCLLKKAEGVLLEEHPIAPIFTYRGSYLKSKHVKNVTLSSLGDIDIKRAYIDEELSD